jgi:hypothetical protein
LIQVIESDFNLNLDLNLDLAEYGMKRNQSNNSTKYKLYYQINNNTFELLVPKFNDFIAISSKIFKILMILQQFPLKLSKC